MIYKYYVEYWHFGVRKWLRPNLSGYLTIQQAESVINKPYNTLKRRLIKEGSEVLYTLKGVKK